MSTFKAFRVFDEGGTVQGRVVEATLDELSAGDVVIKAAYSSVNYKDALAATGAGKIIRRFPLIAGIDVVGHGRIERATRGSEPATRCSSPATTSAWRTTAATRRRVRVPADWVVPMPPGLTTFDAMAIGTAGFTAALSVVRPGAQRPAAGRMARSSSPAPPAASAASRVQCLAARGYQVTALTGQGQRARLPALARGGRRAAAIRRCSRRRGRSRRRRGPAPSTRSAATRSPG